MIEHNWRFVFLARPFEHEGGGQARGTREKLANNAAGSAAPASEAASPGVVAAFSRAVSRAKTPPDTPGLPVVG